MISAVLKIGASVLVAAASGALVAACGGSGDPVSRIQAVAFAGAVNLRSSDVPRMGRMVAGFETKNGPPFGSCAGRVGASDEVVGVESPWFVRSRDQVSLRAGVIAGRPPVAAGHSVVYVMHNAGIASRNVAAAQRASVAGCVERLSVKEASGRYIGGEPYKSQIKATSLPFPLVGVAGYWLRVRSTIAGALYHENKRLPRYEDTFGFAVGPAEIVLHADGVAQPFPAVEERRLLSLLYTRAKAHALS
jgi:hypothetical protein